MSYFHNQTAKPIGRQCSPQHVCLSVISEKSRGRTRRGIVRTIIIRNGRDLLVSQNLIPVRTAVLGIGQNSKFFVKLFSGYPPSPSLASFWKFGFAINISFGKFLARLKDLKAQISKNLLFFQVFTAVPLKVLRKWAWPSISLKSVPSCICSPHVYVVS